MGVLISLFTSKLIDCALSYHENKKNNREIDWRK